jgi:hypothetical protein
MKFGVIMLAGWPKRRVRILLTTHCMFFGEHHAWRGMDFKERVTVVMVCMCDEMGGGESGVRRS